MDISKRVFILTEVPKQLMFHLLWMLQHSDYTWIFFEKMTTYLSFDATTMSSLFANHETPSMVLIQCLVVA